MSQPNGWKGPLPAAPTEPKPPSAGERAVKIGCGVLLGLVLCSGITSVAVIVALTALGDSLDALFSQISSSVDSAAQEPASPPPRSPPPEPPPLG